MNTDMINALVAFAFVTSITPGPNNLMLMASGARFGVRRTIPHMLGISVGFCVMLVLVGVGVMQAFAIFPLLETVLKALSFAFLAYLAFKLATAPPSNTYGPEASQPMTFLGAALFQWVNPKAWAMALTAISLYAPERSLINVAVVGLIFSIVNLPSVGVWVYAGEKMRLVLTNPARQRAFNLVMAALLVTSVLPML
jgi:threonine/homoserine/homoserine lactone efflux protein